MPPAPWELCQRCESHAAGAWEDAWLNVSSAWSQTNGSSLLEQDWEAEYWAKRFGVSRESLEEAVAAVGRSVANVGAYLNEDAVVHRW
jgi:hypothetical protein